MSKYGKGIRSNKREKAVKAHLEPKYAYGNERSYIDYRTEWDGSIEDMMMHIKCARQAGMIDSIIESKINAQFKGIKSAFKDALAVLDSPLYSAMEEGSKDDNGSILRIEYVDHMTGSVTVSYSSNKHHLWWR